jgi:hypothetical protein
MWEQRKEALKKEIAGVENDVDNYASVALLFKGQPVKGSEEIRLDFAAKVLENYQSVVATLAASRLEKNSQHAVVCLAPSPQSYSFATCSADQ